MLIHFLTLILIHLGIMLQDGVFGLGRAKLKAMLVINLFVQVKALGIEGSLGLYGGRDGLGLFHGFQQCGILGRLLFLIERTVALLLIH